MATTSSEITDIIKAQIAGFQGQAESADVGTVVEIGDGIARIHGLGGCMASELLDFGNDVFGLAFNLEEDTVSAIVLGEYTSIKEGGEVRTTGRIVDTPVQTGLKVIDAIIPIGRGQRELIIGDRQTGKSSVAIDAIINQKGKDLTCVYVAIGQKESSVAKLVATLEEHGAMEHTIVVVAGASDPAPLQYLAPFSGCAMGEYFRDNGEDALVVYDDLTKHAWAYRQVSLLTRRPPGREAYPGDVFYLHSRLLERAARLNEENGGGSLTALPLIETQANDISAYIPTNVISITDGQIYLETDLFNQGIRPAMNTGLSVSRVGGDAQTKAMKAVVKSLKADLAQFRELAAFAQFGSDLDKATQAQLRRGERVTEVMKQPQYQPVPLEKQVTIIYAVTNGYVDDIPVAKVKEFERDLFRFMDTQYKPLSDTIAKDKKFDKEIETQVRAMLDEFKKTVSYDDEKPAAPKASGQAKAPEDKAPDNKAPSDVASGRAASSKPATPAGAR